MTKHVFRTLALVAALSLLPLTGAVAASPVITRGSYEETFHDDYILELCGIATETTVTERWTVKEFPDGSTTLHVVRTFVPADPRIPVEKTASTSFIATNGTRTVVGKPIQLIGPQGVRLLDAGWIAFVTPGVIGDQHGHHESLTAELADSYCPA